MKKTIFLLILIALTLSTQAQIKVKKDSTVNLNTVQVNAYRNKLYSEMGRIVTVLDKQDIQGSSAQSIDQLLDYVAGVDIRQRGANNSQADISIRGGSFDQVLVLLNGVNITDPQTGHYNLDIPVSLADISRIEILQGSAARTLGAKAFSGAINIVTEATQANTTKAALSAGSFNTFEQAVSNNSGNSKLNTTVSVSHKTSEGYIHNTDFEFYNTFLQSTLTDSKAGKFSLQASAQQKAYGANGFYSLKFANQYERTKTFLTSLSWELSKKNISYTAQAYWRRHNDRYELDYNKPSWWNYHQTDISGAKANISYLSVAGKTTLGLEVRNEHILSNTLGDARDSLKIPFEDMGYFTKESNRLNSTAVIDHSVSFNQLYISAGISGTNTKKYGTNYAGGADVSYRFNDRNRVYASYNSAVRLPTFTDIYFNSTGLNMFADPNVKPEKSHTIEIGTKINTHHLKIEADLYYRMGKNVIDWVMVAGDTKYRSKNLTDVNAAGGDITVSYQFSNPVIKTACLNYSYLNMDKKADNFDSKYALDYLRHKLTLSLEHKIVSKLSATWKCNYADREGSYADINKVIQPFKPYTLLETRFSWTDKKYSLYLDANNLLDKKYEDYGGLVQPGRNFTIGCRVQLSAK